MHSTHLNIKPLFRAFRRQIGQELEKARFEKNISTEELSRYHLTTKTILKMESGHFNDLTLSTFIFLCELYQKQPVLILLDKSEGRSV